MREQVVGLFLREESLVEAAQMVQAVGYAPSDLDLVSREPVNEPGALSLLRHVHLGRLMEIPEGTWPVALRGGAHRLLRGGGARSGMRATTLRLMGDTGVPGQHPMED